MLGPCGLDDFWLRSSPAAGTGTRSGRCRSRRAGSLTPCARPESRRRTPCCGPSSVAAHPRAREASTVAVLQAGEGADRVGVGGTQALTPDGLALAVDFSGASRAGRPASRIAVANTVAAAVRNRMFPPEDDADGAETVLETGRSSASRAPRCKKFWARGPRRRDGLRLRVSPSSASVPLTHLLVASDCCCCGCCCCPGQQQRLTTTDTFCLYFFVEDPAHVVAVAGKAVLMPCHHRSPLRSTTRSASPTCGPGLRAASGTV